MKKIKLPISQTVSITLIDKGKPVAGVQNRPDKNGMVPLGTIIDSNISNKIDVARENGGQILYATTSIEQQLEEILFIYFMGPFVVYSRNRDMFESEILQSNILTFNKKKELVARIINEKCLLNGKEKNKLQSHLKRIMTWRNAFAHGKVQHNNPDGCFIKYYSGGSNTLYLNEEYWTEVEICFKECTEILKKVLRKLHEPNPKMKADE